MSLRMIRKHTSDGNGNFATSPDFFNQAINSPTLYLCLPKKDKPGQYNLEFNNYLIYKNIIKLQGNTKEYQTNTGVRQTRKGKYIESKQTQKTYQKILNSQALRIK